jgi:hypothetical protein
MNVEKLTGEARKAAKELLKQVDGLLDAAREQAENQAKTHIEIGEKLLEIETSRAWLLTEYKTFDEYLKQHCVPKFGRGRTALYGYKSTAKRLLPSMDRQTLIDMGISKAQVLGQYVKKKGAPPQELITRAIDPAVGVEEFRAEIADTIHEKPESGTWWEFGGFYVSKEERSEYERVMAVARQVLNLPADVSEWSERKAIWGALAAEFLSQHEAAVQEMV